jgi:hypothetical protein
MPKDDTSIDVFGIKPYADSVKIATQGAVDGAAAFFGRICLPVAEEFGFLLRDKVQVWRAANIASMAQATERMVGDAKVHVPPRLFSHIVEEASWIDDKYLQDMWAGLLASSCTKSGDDDSNMLFLNLLSGITKLQGRLLNYIVPNAPKCVTPNGLPHAHRFNIDIPTLTTVSECNDLERIDRELDSLRGRELIFGGFEIDSETTDASVEPTAIALHMYVRCQGSRQSPVEYFSLEVDPELVRDQPTPAIDDA